MAVSLIIWVSLIFGLRKRSRGIRESGAFFLSRPGSSKITKIAFYDKFDPTVSDSGIIQFKGAVKLFPFLEKRNYRVVADIHTHPDSNTDQSYSDKTHPMMRLKGHIAIIAPHYARWIFTMPSHCSVYEYLGNYEWAKFEGVNNPIRLKFF